MHRIVRVLSIELVGEVAAGYLVHTRYSIPEEIVVELVHSIKRVKRVNAGDPVLTGNLMYTGYFSALGRG